MFCCTLCLFVFCLVWFGCLKFEARVGGSDELEERGRVLADDVLGVVAANVVPDDAVLVDVVEDSQAGLGRLVDFELGVIRLGPLEVTRGAPGLAGPTGWLLVGGGELDARAGPEPSVDAEGLKIRSVFAALEVAQPTA